MGFNHDFTLSVKLCPRNSRGAVPFASASTMTLALVSRAWKPLPPGNVKLNGQPLVSWPATTSGDVALSWNHRNRLEQTPSKTSIVRQSLEGSYAIEGTLTIRVYIDGELRRTWSGLTGTSQGYTLAERTADNSDLTKLVYFTITPVNGAYTGTTRSTPPFTMS